MTAQTDQNSYLMKLTIIVMNDLEIFYWGLCYSSMKIQDVRLRVYKRKIYTASVATLNNILPFVT